MRNVLYILGQLTDADAEWLARHGKKLRLSDGEAIVNEGGAIDALYITLDGRFRVTLRDGREVAQLSAGDVIGEVSFVDFSPPTATVSAVGEAVVLVLSKSALQPHLAEDYAFAARFYHALAISLADRLRTATLQLEQEQDRAADIRSRDELFDGMLEVVSQAGERFTRLLRALSG